MRIDLRKKNNNNELIVLFVLICFIYTSLNLLYSTVKPTNLTVPVTVGVVVLAVTFIGAAVFFVYNKRKGEREKIFFIQVAK